MQAVQGANKNHKLPSGVSETLKVEPVRKVIRTVMVGKGGALEKAGNVINLLFEGNWMPIEVSHHPRGGGSRSLATHDMV